MRNDVVPKFPYTALVRVPLLTLIPLVTLILLNKFGFEPLHIMPYHWRDRVLAAVALLFTAGALVQIAAVPYGLIILYLAKVQYSSQYSAALFCGIADLALFALGLVRGSIVK